ncbi:MAG: 50S ribosomal protein L10 [Candidatus Aureabacteria bacterium]|nr:50S ribosomal protein L10 [Candidatus Auribacterota bacterium]
MRAEKKSVVARIKGKIEHSSMLLLADHTGLTSNKLNELRMLLRKSGGDFMVVKNRLLKRAVSDAVLRLLDSCCAGPTGIAVTKGDSAVFSKAIIDFARKNEAPKVKGAYLDGVLLTAAQVGVLASLPPRGVLLSQLLAGMQGPVAGFARCLNEIVRQFVSVVDQIAKKGGQTSQ